MKTPGDHADTKQAWRSRDGGCGRALGQSQRGFLPVLHQGRAEMERKHLETSTALDKVILYLLI